MKILLLGNDRTIQQEPQYYDLYKKFVSDTLPIGTDNQVDFAYIEDLIIQIRNDNFSIMHPQTNYEMKGYDLVFIRGIKFRPSLDVLKVVSTYCRLNKIKIINEYGQGRDGSKLSQAVQFYEHQLPIPPTWFINRGAIACLDSLELTFPMVMKAVLGTRGENNFLVTSTDEIRTIYGQNGALNFVLQQAIPNDGDYRYLVIGEDSILIHRKAQDGSHLNNTSQGAKATLQDVSVIPQDLRERFSLYLVAQALTTGGIDVLQDKNNGEWYVLEVNSQPQLTTGAFLEEKKKLMSLYFEKFILAR